MTPFYNTTPTQIDLEIGTCRTIGSVQFRISVTIIDMSIVVRLPMALLVIIAWNTRDLPLENRLISIFGPSFWNGFGRPKFAEDDIGYTCHDEACEEVESINVCCADRHCLTYRTSKPHDIDDDAENISNLTLILENGGTNICFRIDSHKIPVRSITMGGIQVGD
jgi:hypothetical protein